MALELGFQRLFRLGPSITSIFQFQLGTYQSVRGIKNDMRKKIYHFRARKNKNELLNPELRDKPVIRSTFTDWNYDAELYAFGKRLNETFDGTALRQALTHRSYAVQEEKRLEELGLDPKQMQLNDNEFMSTEGLALLKNTLKPLLKHEFEKFPDEGIIALINYLTSQPVLADISSRIGTKDIILCSDPPPSEEILSTTFLALLSAIHKSGGQAQLQSFVEDFVLTYLCAKNINEIWVIETPWKMLSTLMKDKFNESIEPRLITESGKNTIEAIFIVGIYTEGDKKLIGTGYGETVDIAQEMSARDALSRLFGTREPRPSLKFLEERLFKAANV